MILQLFQIVVSVLLIICVLLQSQGGGISPVFGGGGEMYRSKRNIEKFLFIGTAVLAGLLVISSILLLLPHK
ncbi:MAG: preprotein translocase subunit SecG [Candidatus Levybacteria bacterium]|nr:preprotein translocase subunit SecG [Candidatus Levybacteria bacterium]